MKVPKGFDRLFIPPNKRPKPKAGKPTCPTRGCSNIVKHPTYYCYECIEAANDDGGGTGWR